MAGATPKKITLYLYTDKNEEDLLLWNFLDSTQAKSQTLKKILKEYVATGTVNPQHNLTPANIINYATPSILDEVDDLDDCNITEFDV